jgi:hypothetical protein
VRISIYIYIYIHAYIHTYTHTYIQIFFDELFSSCESDHEAHITAVQKTIKDILLPSIRRKVADTLEDRLEKDSDSSFDQRIENFYQPIEDEVERCTMKFVANYRRLLPLRSSRSKHLSSMREPFFRASVKIFSKPESYTSKDEVLEEIRAKSGQVPDLVVQYVYGKKLSLSLPSSSSSSGNKASAVRNDAQTRRLPLDEITDIMRKGPGSVFTEAQNAAKIVFNAKFYAIVKDIPHMFLQDAVDVHKRFEKDLMSIIQAPKRSSSSNLRMLLGHGSGLGSLDPDIGNVPVVDAHLLTKINDNAPEGTKLSPATRFYDPEKDGYCCFRALAACA